MKSYRWTFVWRHSNGLLAETEEHRVVSAIERPSMMESTLRVSRMFKPPFSDCVPQVLSRERA